MNTWDEIQAAPAYVVNMDRQPDRLQVSTRRMADAGYTNIIRWRATDGRTDDLDAAWKAHGSPKLDAHDIHFVNVADHPYKQGTLLSHLSLWKHIINNEIPVATIFQDDIVFHKDWHQLAPAYFEAMPKDFQMCYMGHHCGCGLPYEILRVPVYCDHAVIITLAGARILYDRILREPDGVRTIDCIIHDFQVKDVHEGVPFLNWYAWNAERFPDDTVQKNPEHGHKDQGLVFQDYSG